MRTFITPPIETVRFGEGSLTSLSALVEMFGSTRPFIVLSSTIANSPIGEMIRAQLEHTVVAEFSGIPQHVPRTAVLSAAQAARAHGCDVLISAGGGTAIDCAKAVALCLAANIRSESDFERYRAHRMPDGEIRLPADPGPMVPHIAIPTTLSAAEHTDLAGVTDESGTKHIYRFRHLAPRAVILDPYATSLTPAELWAASGVRALDHAVESMLAAGSMPFVDALASQAIRMLRENLLHSVLHPADTPARSACLEASWLSIFGITNTGAGLSHAIGHQLATRFDLLHGIASAIMLPHVMEFNAAETQEKLALVETAIRNAEDPIDTTAPELVRAFIASLPLPNRISNAGGHTHAFREMAREITGDISLAANPRPVSESDIVELFEAAW